MARYQCTLFFTATASLFLSLATSNARCEERNDFKLFLSETIARLQLESQSAKRHEQPAFEAAIDSLVRLRDHESWPALTSDTALSALSNTRWLSKPNNEGFRQSLTFGNGTGHWQKSSRSLPFSFTWQTESNRVRLNHHRGGGFSDYSLTIIDRTYVYELNGDTLNLRRGSEVLKWERVPDQNGRHAHPSKEKAD